MGFISCFSQKLPHKPPYNQPFIQTVSSSSSSDSAMLRHCVSNQRMKWEVFSWSQSKTDIPSLFSNRSGQYLAECDSMNPVHWVCSEIVSVFKLSGFFPPYCSSYPLAVSHGWKGPPAPTIPHAPSVTGVWHKYRSAAVVPLCYNKYHRGHWYYFGRRTVEI